MKKYLKTIGIIGAVLIGVSRYRRKTREIKSQKDIGEKVGAYYALLNKWLMLRQQGRTLENYFISKDIHTIAIYGYKELGQRLYYELKDSNVQVKYIIDKNADMFNTEIDIYEPDEELPLVDAIVVTATYYFDEIEDELSDKVDYPIISLQDVLI